jgi:hypothetical protein
MDASKQLSTLSLGKWVTFRKTTQTDSLFQSMILIIIWEIIYKKFI